MFRAAIASQAQIASCGLQLPLDSLVWRIDDPEIRAGLVRAVDRGDLDSRLADELAREFTRTEPSIDTTPRAIRETDSGTVVEATTRGMDGGDIAVNGRFIEDPEVYLRDRFEANRDAARQAFERNNVDFERSQGGIDGLAIDNNGELTVIEAKTKNHNGRTTRDKSGMGRTVNGEQMSEEWLTAKFQEMNDRPALRNSGASWRRSRARDTSSSTTDWSPTSP